MNKRRRIAHKISCDADLHGFMLNTGQDIHSLTDSQRQPSDLIDQLRQTNRPIVLTVNGRAAVVVAQAADANQQVLTPLHADEMQAVGWRRFH